MILTFLKGCQLPGLPLSPPGRCLWSPSLHTAGLGPGTLLQELEESQGPGSPARLYLSLHSASPTTGTWASLSLKQGMFTRSYIEVWSLQQFTWIQCTSHYMEV